MPAMPDPTFAIISRRAGPPELTAMRVYRYSGRGSGWFKRYGRGGEADQTDPEPSAVRIEIDACGGILDRPGPASAQPARLEGVGSRA
jgi:hypothetical protein